MSAVSVCMPVTRTVGDGGSVAFNGKTYTHVDLFPYGGQEVFLDMEIDVDSERSYFRVYTMIEEEICVIEMDDVESIGEAVNGNL